MAAPRILTVSHFYEAHGGGIERVAAALNRAMLAQGCAVAWAAADEGVLPDATTADAVALRCVNPIEAATGLPMPIPLPRALARLAAAVRACDAVIVHDALYLTSIAAVLLARYHRRKVVLIQHIAAVPFSSRVLRAVMTLANRLVAAPMIKAADEVVFISDTVRRAFAGVARSRPPHLAFNGVDADLFRPATPAARRATRDELSLGDDTVLLFVGRFVEKKGLEILRHVAAASPATRFVLAGRGPIDPDAWGLANVTIVRDRSGAALAALYAAADGFVLPSVGEGYPLVVQEALACGLPVVCGDETSRADPAATRWLAGVAIDLADPIGSARRVGAAIDALDVGAEDRAAMRAHAVVAYDWAAMARTVITLCQPAARTRHLAADAAARSAAV